MPYIEQYLLIRDNTTSVSHQKSGRNNTKLQLLIERLLEEIFRYDN